MEPRPEQVSRVYSIGQDKSLHLWNLHMQKREEIFFGHTATPTCIDILQKERPVTGGLDSTVRVWKIASDSHLLFDTRREYVDTVSQLNNHRTLSGHQDGSILLWSVSHRKPVCFVEDGHGQGSWITALGSLRYSNTFFSGSDNGMIRTWKIESQRTTSKNVRDTSSTKKNTEILPVSKVQIPVTGVVTQIATSGNGELLFSSIGREHRLGRWKCLKQAKNGLLIARLTGSLNSVNPTVPKDGVF